MKITERAANKDLRDLTMEIRDALRRGEACVIPNASLYRTDRPQHKGKHGSIGTLGDSELEAGLPFQIFESLKEVLHNPDPYFSMNNVRLFGPISEKDYPHYHGYSKKDLAALHAQGKRGAMQTIVIVIQAIAPYDEKTQNVNFGRTVSNIRDGKGNSAVVLITEEGGLLRKYDVSVGDAVILPSGAYHTFSALPGIYASYAALEICDKADAMYQTHFFEAAYDAQAIIARTVEKETGKRPKDVSSLTLASVPSLKAYTQKAAGVPKLRPGQVT